MPIYEIVCRDCGYRGETMTRSVDSPLVCPTCSGTGTEKQLSLPSSLTGRPASTHPGPNDRACCGNTPSQAGCAGPGSCCGNRT